MSRKDFERFRRSVLEDPALQKQLRAFTRRDAFAARLVKLGAERGFEFTAEEVREAIGKGRRLWNKRWLQ